MIAGICMVRDEADIIETTVRYHLDQGLGIIYIVDNGSTDGTLEIVERLSRYDPRMYWTEDRGKFHQSEALTSMARDASRDGAEWIVPFDADEFWFAPSGLARELSECQGGYLRASVINYIQRREVVYLSRGAVLQAEYRVDKQRGPAEHSRSLVENDEISFVEMEYPPKHISRAAVGLEISAGNHAVSGAGQMVIMPTIRCLHVPLRARDILQLKVQQSRRLDEAGYPEWHGWHLRRLARLAEAGLLDEEWMRNSQSSGVLQTARGAIRLVYDPILKHLLSQYMTASFSSSSQFTAF
jgi:Glycosyl transferase family 2